MRLSVEERLDPFTRLSPFSTGTLESCRFGDGEVFKAAVNARLGEPPPVRNQAPGPSTSGFRVAFDAAPSDKED